MSKQPPTSDDDLCGLLCVPPGMSAKQVTDFNSTFSKLSDEEKRTVIGSIVSAAKARGASVVTISDKKTDSADPPK